MPEKGHIVRAGIADASAPSPSSGGFLFQKRPKGLFILDPCWWDAFYAPEDRAVLRKRIEFPERVFSAEQVRDDPSLLGEVELIFSGWGGPRFDAAILDAAPRLQAVFYGGGSVRDLVTDEFWERSIALTSAAPANAIPVAEFTLAQIILSLKRAWWHIGELRRTHDYPSHTSRGNGMAGAYQSTVGIISLGMIGRQVRKLLRMLEVQVLAYDPFVTPETAAAMDVELVSLEELFERSDVVTIHTPWLKETEGLITEDLIAMMKPRATLINTARGAVIDEAGMIEALRRRPDLFAVLDVTCENSLDADSPLYSLSNVVLTPHIAGSYSGECRRMGRMMIEEAERFLDGNGLRWGISREKAAISA